MMLLLRKAHPATRTMIGGDPTPEQAKAGDYPKLRQDWHGLKIAIEHPEGTVREGVDETGKPWRTVFRYAYGEILETMGMDGDPVDVFIGNYPDAPEVYVVQQMKRKQWDVADEQKCMINFGSMDEARQAYLAHYDDPRFFGGITAMPVAEFITKVRSTREKPTMIKSVIFLKTHVEGYTRKDGTYVAAHEDARIQKHQVKDVAERIAGRFREHGFAADVEHSGSRAGASSYVKVHDPSTGRSVADTIRVSDHSKGAFNSQFHHHVTAHSDIDPVSNRVLALANDMRAAGKSAGVKAMEQYEAKAAEIRLKNARKKQEKGKPLTNSEREALEASGELRKAQTVAIFFKGFVGPYMRGGKMVNLKGYHGSRTKKVHATTGQTSLFGDLAPPPEVKQTAKVARALTTWMQRHGGPAGMARLLADMSPEHQEKLVDAMAKIGKTDAATVRGLLDDGQKAPAGTGERDLFSEPEQSAAKEAPQEKPKNNLAEGLPKTEGEVIARKELTMMVNKRQENGKFSRYATGRYIITLQSAEGKKFIIAYSVMSKNGVSTTVMIPTEMLEDGAFSKLNDEAIKLFNAPSGGLFDGDKEDTITMPRAEAVKEHERLVDVLRSPSHEDDKAEAKKQAEELKEYKGEDASDDQEQTREDYKATVDKISEHHAKTIGKQSVAQLKKMIQGKIKEGFNRFEKTANGDRVLTDGKRAYNITQNEQLRPYGPLIEAMVAHANAKPAAKPKAPAKKVEYTTDANGVPRDKNGYARMKMGRKNVVILPFGDSGLYAIRDAKTAITQMGEDGKPLVFTNEAAAIAHVRGGQSTTKPTPKKILTVAAGTTAAAGATAKQPTKAQQTRARRQAVLDVLGDGWKADAGVDGAKDRYTKVFSKEDGGKLEVTIMPERTVEGTFYVGSYHRGGKRTGAGSNDSSAKTIEEAKAIAERFAGANAKPTYTPTTTDDHPAPMPRSLMRGVPEDRLDEWKDLHRQQHELHHYELGQVREKLERHRSKRNKAQAALRESEAAVASLRGAPVPDPAREAEAQKMVDKHHAEFTKLAREQDALTGQHQALYEKIAKLGRAKDKILDGSGDIDRDFASMAKRSASEQQDYEKSMLKMYREHYKAKDADRKRKPEPMTKSILFLRHLAS